MSRYDVIIAGAGISGLSLAHYCAKEGLKPLVLEAAPRAGGTFHSHVFPGTGGFWLELGAHTCYNSYGSLLGIMEDLDAMGKILKREKVGFRMLSAGKVVSIPSRMNFPELIVSAPRILFLRKEGNTVKSYYSPIVGRRNYEGVFGPVFEAVLSQQADDFPADTLFRKRPRRKGVARSFTLQGGLAAITDAIAAGPGIEVRTGSPARGVSFKGGVFVVETESGEGLECRFLGLATPPDRAAGILQASFPEISDRLSSIKVKDVETVGVVARKEDIPVPPLAGLVAKGDLFTSMVSRDIVKHSEYRGFSFHFRQGAGYEDKLKRICEVLGVERVKLMHVAERTNRVPSLSPYHEKLAGEIDGLLAGKPFMLTGNYFTGLAIEDCVARSRNEFERLRAMLK